MGPATAANPMARLELSIPVKGDEGGKREATHLPGEERD
ncbi:hypothetical protein CCACVL1_03355 [Corchorus capsularis]|uniref:Uncharacterized protein n=1 Tax=Corchorus capsularis TaxID=210143 RepID=A0A1R3JZY9_COCAP|nr:hypothetical protein CCACVL1_03355 [Corchorus capsularis]